MENLFNLIIAFGLGTIFMLPMAILIWFTEDTRLGRRLMRKVFKKLGL